MDCLEYAMIGRFFYEEHLAIRCREGEERVKTLKPPTYHSGGKVPKDALYRSDNQALLKIDMIPAVDILYKALGRVKMLVKTKYDENVGIRLIPKILHACERRGIPQNHAPGIMLLYLEHCEGCKWRHLVPDMLKGKQRSLAHVEKLRRAGRDDEAKLGSEDWPEYMVSAVADFVKEARRFRQ